MEFTTMNAATKRIGNSGVIRPCIALMLILIMVSPANSQNGLSCFNQFTWVGPPTVDGNVATDNGWTNSFRYVFYNGTTTPDVIFQAIKDDCNVYLSFQVANDNDIGDIGDEIVLLFDPDGTSNQPNYRRIQIHPNTNSTIGYPLPPASVAYYSGYSGSSWTTSMESAPPSSTCASGNPPAWRTEVGHPSAGFWNVEMSIPIWPDASHPEYGMNFTSSMNFGFYFDVLVADETVIDTGGVACTTNGDCPITEFPWPSAAATLCSGVANLLDCDDTKTPARTNWGSGNLFSGPPTSTPCKGLYLDATDINTNNTPTDLMLLDQPTSSTANVFSANVHNNSSSTVHGVTATFRIENYGVGSMWATIPTGNNPTAPPQDVTTTGLLFSTSPWVGPPPGPSYTTYCPTKNPSDPTCHLHQCIRVDLSTSDPNAVLANDSFIRNMNFNVPASRASVYAEVNGTGYPPRPNASTQQFDLRVFTKEQVFKPGDQKIPAEVARGGENNEISQLTMEIQSCRHTGRFIKMGNNKYELCQSIGGYGHVFNHIGPVDNWNHVLAGGQTGNGGTSFAKLTNNVYRLEVPNSNPVAIVTTQVEAKHCAGLFGAAWLFPLGGIFIVGLLVYRPYRKRKYQGSPQKED